MRTTRLCAALLLFSVYACGGKAIVDDPIGAGGSGGAGGEGAAGNAGGTTNNVSTSVTGTTVGGGSIDTVAVSVGTGSGGTTTGGGAACEKACAAFWVCTQQDNLCPGINPGGEQEFKAFCMDGCAQGPLEDFVDPNDCKGTIDFFLQISDEFAEFCKGN